MHLENAGRPAGDNFHSGGNYPFCHKPSIKAGIETGQAQGHRRPGAGNNWDINIDRCNIRHKLDIFPI